MSFFGEYYCFERKTNHCLVNLNLSTSVLYITGQIEHRIGMIETSLSRLGLILDSVQGDVMQANKGTKEIALESKYTRSVDCHCVNKIAMY